MRKVSEGNGDEKKSEGSNFMWKAASMGTKISPKK